jgi:WASH complex subunit strumpellin
MVRTINVSPKVLADLDIVSDSSYAWNIIGEFTGLLHQRIKENPPIVLLLRSTFLKFSSILSLPLVRISQAGSKDDISVADYYSSQLVAYVRRVLEIIPSSVFQTLDEIITLQTNKLKPLPTKVERKLIKDYVQIEDRYTLARSTNQVSVYTQGVLAMKTTLLGIIKLDPKQILEDGIRLELVRQISVAMHEHLDFKTGKVDDFEGRLLRLGVKLDGFRRSFEYIQDYINLYGLRIWQEEFSRIINYSVEQESNTFLRKKIFDWQSIYQSDAIPIPVFVPPPHAKESANFMGRLAREVLRQTDPSKTVYVESLQGWYDSEKMREAVGIRTFSLLHKGVGIFGLTGMDRLLCFMTVRDMGRFVALYRQTVNAPVQQFIAKLSGELNPTSQFPPNTQKLYSVALSKTQKLWGGFLE